MKWKFLALLVIMAFTTPLSAEEGKDAEFLKRGGQLLSLGDYVGASRAFEQAVSVNPASPDANLRLGLCYLNLGNDEYRTDPAVLGKAVQAFTRALTLKPELAEARYHLGVTYLALYEKESAVREYGRLKNLDKQLASELLARIESYAAPKGYRQVGSPGDSGGTLTKVAIVGNMVLVPVTLRNGERSVEATLILDTGASITTITSELASRLNIDMGQTTKTLGMVVGGTFVKAWQTRLNSVSVGPHTKNDMAIDIIEHKGPEVPYDGLLGMDFLRNRKYHVDFTNRVINWAP
jgi:hypothetical protein